MIMHMDKATAVMLTPLITYLHDQISDQSCKIKVFCQFVLNPALNASQSSYNPIRKFQLINSARKKKATHHSIRKHRVGCGFFLFSLHKEAITKLNVAIARTRQAGSGFLGTGLTKALHFIFFSAGSIENKTPPKLLDTIS